MTLCDTSPSEIYRKKARVNSRYYSSVYHPLWSESKEIIRALTLIKETAIILGENASWARSDSWKLFSSMLSLLLLDKLSRCFVMRSSRTTKLRLLAHWERGMTKMMMATFLWTDEVLFWLLLSSSFTRNSGASVIMNCWLILSNITPGAVLGHCGVSCAAELMTLGRIGSVFVARCCVESATLRTRSFDALKNMHEGKYLWFVFPFSSELFQNVFAWTGWSYLSVSCMKNWFSSQMTETGASTAPKVHSQGRFLDETHSDQNYKNSTKNLESRNTARLTMFRGNSAHDTEQDQSKMHIDASLKILAHLQQK